MALEEHINCEKGEEGEGEEEEEEGEEYLYPKHIYAPCPDRILVHTDCIAEIYCIYVCIYISLCTEHI